MIYTIAFSDIGWKIVPVFSSRNCKRIFIHVITLSCAFLFDRRFLVCTSDVLIKRSLM